MDTRRVAERRGVRYEGAASQGKRLDGRDRGFEDAEGVGAELVEDPVQ
jgi:hypothetical protein